VQKHYRKHCNTKKWFPFSRYCRAASLAGRASFQPESISTHGNVSALEDRTRDNPVQKTFVEENLHNFILAGMRSAGFHNFSGGVENKPSRLEVCCNLN
jgi:hypothetical protein